MQGDRLALGLCYDASSIEAFDCDIAYERGRRRGSARISSLNSTYPDLPCAQFCAMNHPQIPLCIACTWMPVNPTPLFKGASLEI